MTTADKVFGWSMFILFYYLIGTGVGLVLDNGLGLVPLSDDSSPAEYIGLILLWPLFVIKYLAIGIWAVLSAGFSLLI